MKEGNGMYRKQWMKVLNIFLLLMAIISLSACDSKEEKLLKTDLSNTIESILGKNSNGDIYISGASFADEKSYRVILDNKVGNQVCEKVEYKIEKIEIDGNTAQVAVFVKSPDVPRIFDEILEGGNVKSVEDLLSELSIRLDENYITMEKTIQCSLEFKDKHWYLLSNPELFNILSGNMLDYYMEFNQDTVDDLMEGERYEE